MKTETGGGGEGHFNWGLHSLGKKEKKKKKDIV